MEPSLPSPYELIPPSQLPKLATDHKAMALHGPKVMMANTASELKGSMVAARKQAKNKPGIPNSAQ